MFPLDGVTTAQLQQLCRVLWDWDICAGCERDGACSQGPGCPWPLRAAALRPFFDVYRAATAAYLPDSPVGGLGALRSHEELLDAVRHLQRHRREPRARVTAALFAARAPPPPERDQHRAVGLAVRVLTTVGSASERPLPGALLEAGSGAPPAVWRSDRSLADFVDALFPPRRPPALDADEDAGAGPPIADGLTAVALRRVAGLAIEPTDDLSRHLRFDARAGTVCVFHHVVLLREHLAAARRPGTSPLLPPQLVLETLRTLAALFPTDAESAALLRALVARKGFDPLMRRIASVVAQALPDGDEAADAFVYWRPRLLDLRDELDNPRPRRALDAWLKQRSKARHVMMASMAGIAVAVVLGVLGLAVSIFQAWIAYQQWKYPP